VHRLLTIRTPIGRKLRPKLLSHGAPLAARAITNQLGDDPRQVRLVEGVLLDLLLGVGEHRVLMFEMHDVA
jgi:hypothetical protein